MMSLLIRNCRKVTRLLIERRERRLGAVEWVAVRMHLGICEMCNRFAGQLELMNRALSRWKSYRESEDEHTPDGGP